MQDTTQDLTRARGEARTAGAQIIPGGIEAPALYVIEGTRPFGQYSESVGFSHVIPSPKLDSRMGDQTAALYRSTRNALEIRISFGRWPALPPSRSSLFRKRSYTRR